METNTQKRKNVRLKIIELMLPTKIDKYHQIKKNSKKLSTRLQASQIHCLSRSEFQVCKLAAGGEIKRF